MKRNELMDCFQDTLKLSYMESVAYLTEAAKKSNKVYQEGFVSKSRPHHENGEIIVEANTTFAAAKKYRIYGKTAVLNFANPHIPGGGVQNGAMAQEECLCRSSNLYVCLTDNNVLEDYYEYHKKMKHYFFSDRLIYTQGVTVFKNDNTIPQLMNKNEWFSVDVITCAAPYIAERKYTNRKALTELFKNRIKNILEAARDNKIDVLILGAFGCGAFKNPPDVVAKAFHDVIRENHYEDSFEKIVFAIKSSVNNAPCTACPNITAFEMEFYGVSQELCKERMSGGAPVAYAYGDAIMPSGRVQQAGDAFLKYYNWKRTNKYFGKQFSILGDSISTLIGYNPRGYHLFYADDICEKTGVREMRDTWWGKVIDYFGGELLVNNSWSGSRVTKLPKQDSLFPAGCSDERTSRLHINSVMPDVIIVYLGTNDWAFGVTSDRQLNYESFAYAYESMLAKIKTNYPDSEIWCCTLNETFMSGNPAFTFPHSYGGTHIEVYNEIIRSVVVNSNCRLIDLYENHMPYDSVDGSHPTTNGMNTLATMVIRSLAGKEAGQFMDCENDNHEYEMLDTVIEGKYKVLKLIGQGGYFKIYLAIDERLNKQWAIKVCDKNNDNYNSVIYEVIMQEAYMMMKLDHPAVPKVVDIIENERYILIVREYIEGKTLESLVKEHGAQPAKKVIEWGKQICSVLDYLHTLNPPHIHRDLKPSNLVIQADGNIKLIDYGIMISEDLQKTEDDICSLGTVGYASPEHYVGKRQMDARSDIYSIGATLYRLVTGLDPCEPPYVLKPICQINPSLPKGLEYIICKCIELDKNKRYQNCAELLYDLNNYSKLPQKKGIAYFLNFVKREGEKKSINVQRVRMISRV